MNWWCSASDAAWRWEWQAYPGVWLAMGLLVAGYLRLWRGAPSPGAAPSERFYLGAGVVAIWLAIDWPVGALGASYLSWVHTVQYLLISLVGAPLLLLAIPEAVIRRTSARQPVKGFLHLAAHPVFALAVFNVILFVTHLPLIVDGPMKSQLGNFAVDVAWLVGGLALWWPVIAPDGIGRITPPVKIGYLFLSTIPPTIPAAYLTFAKHPIYALYELAPRVPGMDVPAQVDQQLSGLIMKVIGDPILWLAMAIVFFRWARRERAEIPAPQPTMT
jgi:putative membrane protein